MLNLPRQTLAKVKKYLTRQQQSVEAQIEAIEKDDPLLLQTAVEAPESGTDSWQADVHVKVVAVKNDLISLSKKITRSLLRIKKGTYGECENCGKKIQVDRLEAMPMANLCLKCSQKTSRYGISK